VETIEGWMLDVYVVDDRAFLWVVDEGGEAHKLVDRYRPEIYLEIGEGQLIDDVALELEQLSGALSAEVVRKAIAFTSREPRPLVKLVLRGARGFGGILRMLENHPAVKEVYNADLSHVQRYVITKLCIAPTSRVEATASASGELREIREVGDGDELRPPGFKVATLLLTTNSSRITPNPSRDPITRIELFTDGRCYVLEGGDEAGLLAQLEELVDELDPDIVLAEDCDGFTMPYLFRRARINGVELRLGRDKQYPFDGSSRHLGEMGGRVCMDTGYLGSSFFDWGLAGLSERCRFSLLPPRIAVRWMTNRAIDTRVCYELNRMGYVIPRNRGGYVWSRELSKVIERDRGGMILTPRIGRVYENVGEIDFDSYFPNIIVKHNISFETITPEGVDRENRGILPIMVEEFLDRRLRLKKLKKKLPRDSKEYEWCSQRVDALKLALVCVYGISGCCWNRFGNVLAFEEINRVARDGMIKAKKIARSKGFEIVYMDTDSLFVSRGNASKEDYEELAKEIGEAVGMPMSLDHHYRYVVFTRLKTDPLGIMGAQKRYFGITYDGEIVARGIELRRHDTPEYIRQIQQKAIATLFSYETAEEVVSRGVKECLKLLEEAKKEILSGKVALEEITISRVLRKELGEYRSKQLHVIVAEIEKNLGRSLGPGDEVEYVVRDYDNRDKLYRATPVKQATSYDKNHYSRLLDEAMGTIIGTFLGRSP